MKTGIEYKKQTRIARAKRSALGRTFCRLCGNTAGGVMMEYVILAVLIAAAVVAAVMFFGRGIKEGLTTATHAIAGESGAAAVTAAKAKGEAVSAEAESETYRKTLADK